MDQQKNQMILIIVLLVVAILFSIGSIMVSLNAGDNLVPPTSTNKITKIESDNGNIAIEILPPPIGS